MMASWKDRGEVVGLLLGKGARPDLEDKDGWTALPPTTRLTDTIAKEAGDSLSSSTARLPPWGRAPRTLQLLASSRRKRERILEVDEFPLQQIRLMAISAISVFTHACLFLPMATGV